MHPYVQRFSNVSDEITLGREIKLPIDENTKYSIKDYRESLY